MLVVEQQCTDRCVVASFCCRDDDIVWAKTNPAIGSANSQQSRRKEAASNWRLRRDEPSKAGATYKVGAAQARKHKHSQHAECEREALLIL